MDSQTDWQSDRHLNHYKQTTRVSVKVGGGYINNQWNVCKAKSASCLLDLFCVIWKQEQIIFDILQLHLIHVITSVQSRIYILKTLLSLMFLIESKRYFRQNWQRYICTVFTSYILYYTFVTSFKMWDFQFFVCVAQSTCSRQM